TWLLAKPSEVETDALRCNQSPTSDADVISDVRTLYDAQAFGTTPVKGDITGTQVISAWSAGAKTFQTTGQWTYDTYGRRTGATDALGNHSQTAFTPATGGPITAVTTTDPMGFVTTVTDAPEWGQPIAVVDPNNKRTDLAIDPLGRLVSVWQP